ncbi:Ig-like domain-containing protein [Marinobacter subterrani]|uniref:Bacterial Ig-like domain n=1 Tax=Marinobacter subterrani TaxID=1658765 RepID=A0A0J7J5G4_9GAMM|nr:Ig-like domain-containing protein [Marinobacter subterrani]KMQ73432.1 Bacterial Ig-like domain [Marinobacter subterrani]
MKYTKTLALIPAILLAACGGDKQTMKPDLATGSVVYSYPTDGQTGVSPKSDIVIRFSNPVAETEANLQSKILVNDGSNTIAFTATKVDGGRSVKLTPNTPLSLGAEYSVSFSEPLTASGATDIGTPNANGPEGIQFHTRGGYTGISALDSLSSDFSVANMVPSPTGLLRAMDFSTFRLLLTQPVNPRWKEMGGNIVLEDDQGNAVPASVFVDERRVTVDPCLTEDPAQCGTKDDQLKSGATYTLKIQDLPSLTSPGTTLNFSQDFTVRETGPTVVVYQEVVDSGLGDGASEEQATKSILNGQPINGVTLNSVLQGTAGPSQQTGGLYAELAYAPSFDADEALPLRVPKNSILNSTSLEVKINGRVPVINPETNQIQQTGNIKVTMLSDASGYLLPNAYTDDINAPRHVRLFMDVAMNTEEAQPNASLSQNLLGVELDGIALVKDGVLNIDAIGVVEPNLLGQEYTDSTIAFHLEAKTDADSVLDAAELWKPDTTSPSLVSWMPGPDSAIPGNRDQMQRPGDPVILNFDEPIDAETVAEGIVLDEGGTALTVGGGNLRAYVDGTAVVINPVGGLKHGVPYTVQISSQLTDMAGNPATSQALPFALPAIKNGSGLAARSPFALTTYPGYPCVTENQDLLNGSHGTCVDAAPAGLSDSLVRDQLPVTTLPENRPIVVKFSQSMDLSTINNDTFVVEAVADAASPAAIGSEARVEGRLELNNQQIRFYPDTPWQPGQMYRYTMRSATNGDCSTGGYICSGEQLPLDTDLLLGQANDGGPDLTIYFTGTDRVNSVFTPLRNLPIRDTNSNYVVDCGTAGGTDCLEPFNHDSDGSGGYKPSANTAKLLVTGETATVLGAPADAVVGCSKSGADYPCPEKKFIYQTYGLNTEVIGPAKDDSGNIIGVRVLLYPTMLMTTNASVFLQGLGEQRTGPQILRMTYGAPTPDNPLGLVEGVIKEGPDGRPIFSTTADLTLDAPDLTVPLSGLLRHNLYSYPFSLELEGLITFFDDGRMQIEQRNTNNPKLDVLVTTDSALINTGADLLTCVISLFSECGSLLSGTDSNSGAVKIPLEIPSQGVYLNFISNPMKELPARP